jgi:hypothetical protein
VELAFELLCIKLAEYWKDGWELRMYSDGSGKIIAYDEWDNTHNTVYKWDKFIEFCEHYNLS